MMKMTKPAPRILVVARTTPMDSSNGMVMRMMVAMLMGALLMLLATKAMAQVQPTMSPPAHRVEGARGEVVRLSARLTVDGTTPISGRMVRFEWTSDALAGSWRPVGSSMTGPKGWAFIESFEIPMSPMDDNVRIRASFAGDSVGIYGPASTTYRIAIRKN